MATVEDDRTAEQRKTHDWLVVGTDKFMSNWGGAEGGTSVAAWACSYENYRKVEAWVKNRGDMLRVRVVMDSPKERYRAPRGCKHLHIYVVDDKHPALY